MIDLGHWLAFTVASLCVAVLPGPGVANIVGHALASGRRTALAAVAGAVAGNLVAMSSALTGVGPLLLAFPGALRLVELAGATYLVALGSAALVRQVQPSAGSRARGVSPRAAFAGTIATSALNPKSLVFFLAFAPQFIGMDRSYPLQCSILVATFAAVVAVTDSAYAFAAASVAEALRSRRATERTRRAGALILIGMGLAAVLR